MPKNTAAPMPDDFDRDVLDDLEADMTGEVVPFERRRPGARPAYGTPDSATASSAAGAPEVVEGDVLDDEPGTSVDRIRPATSEDEPDADDTDSDDQDDDADGDHDGTDAESVEVLEGVVMDAAPVDPMDTVDTAPWRRTTTAARRRPVVPPALTSLSELRMASKWAASQAGYVASFHAMRVPKYAAYTAWYAPVGAYRCASKLARWSTAEEGNWSLRQDAARRNDPGDWLRLDRQRQRESVWRTWVAGGTFVAAIVALAVVAYGPIPDLARAAVVTVAVLLAARIGRPADRPILERVTAGTKYRKLTAELVRRGLLSLGIAQMNSAVAKDPNAITFPTEIHRDGPGHLATVDLPYGVEAADVIARRGRLASALRLPLDQVWPEHAAGHPGRLALWVGHEPASAMKQPVWPLLKAGRVDVFNDFPFATTPRLEPVKAALMFRNWLVGGQPGSGKSFAVRLLILAAALDPRCEIRGYELAGKGDYRPLEPVLAEYGNGMDDQTLARCAAMIDWLYAEVQRRSLRVDHYARLGKAPENKTTPELASLPGSGLHPLVVFIDEAQELFTSPYGKEAGAILEKTMKLARAYGVCVIIGTQIPDKDSLPTGITRVINTRYCLSVIDQVANDMIVGTGAYKQGLRATVFEPGVEAGWGILRGVGKPGGRRSYYLNNADAARVVARAVELRQAAGTMPAAPVEREVGPSYDLLSDLLQVWPADQDKAWNETLIDHLAVLRPEVYEGWEPDQLTKALKPHGVEVGQIHRRPEGGGKPVNRRGPTRADVLAAVTQRSKTASGD
jgi:S-DNA-T family DNA segregation ATPase FtsK/SpoIIIE